MHSHPAASPAGGVDLASKQELSEPTELRLFRTAVNKHWPVTDDLRDRAIQTAAAILDDPSPVRRLGAVRAIILADSLNVRREATASAEASALLSASTSALRAALANPALRQALTAIDPSQAPSPHTEQPDSTPPAKDT
jgi:hypothetical protein